jgi:hypothetical protein
MTEPARSPSPILELAPLKKSGDRFWGVIFSGLASTALSLLIVYLLLHFADVNVMGWYLNYIFPGGAILVGLLASSGYALAAWRTGLKVRGRLLVAIIALQLAAYFTAKYVEFLINGPFADPVAGHVLGFGEYYHYATIMMSWQEDTGKPSAPLGSIGYLVRAGEIIGFSLGALIMPFVLMKAPYCELCERYMKTLSLALIPASGMEDNGDRASPQTPKEALETANAEMQAYVADALAGNSSAFLSRLAILRPRRKQIERRTRRLDMALVYCKNCSQSLLSFTLVEGADDSHIKRVLMSQTELARPFVNEILLSPVLKLKSTIY